MKKPKKEPVKVLPVVKTYRLLTPDGEAKTAAERALVDAVMAWYTTVTLGEHNIASEVDKYLLKKAVDYRKKLNLPELPE